MNCACMDMPRVWSVKNSSHKSIRERERDAVIQNNTQGQVNMQMNFLFQYQEQKALIENNFKMPKISRLLTQPDKGHF